MDSLHSRIRVLRLQQQRTLKDIADACGFTVSLLSKIESGKSTPPVATLTRIAKALGTNVGNLLEEAGESSTVLTPASKLRVLPATRADKGYEFHLLAAERSSKVMQPFIFTAERGKVKPSPMSHSGEEFIHVLSGRMRYRVGEVTFTLGLGDSLYFNAEERHDLEPLSLKVRYLAVFVERGPKRSNKRPANI